MGLRSIRMCLWVALAWLALVGEAMSDVASRQYYTDTRLFSVIPEKGIETYRSYGGGGAGGPNVVLGLSVNDGRRFDVEVETTLRSGQFIATLRIQPKKSDEQTKESNREFNLTGLQPQIVEIARDDDGRVYQLQLLPMIREFKAPAKFDTNALRLDFWNFQSSPVIVNDQDYVGRLGMSSGQFATIELSGTAKVEFSLVPFRGARSMGSLKDGTINISHDDGTSIQISGVTNGVHRQTLAGGPYQVFVRWSEASISDEEHKKHLAETIASVRKKIEDGDLPAGANWLERLERAQDSDRIMIMSNSLGPIPRADRIQ